MRTWTWINFSHISRFSLRCRFVPGSDRVQFHRLLVLYVTASAAAEDFSCKHISSPKNSANISQTCNIYQVNQPTWTDAIVALVSGVQKRYHKPVDHKHDHAESMIDSSWTWRAMLAIAHARPVTINISMLAIGILVASHTEEVLAWLVSVDSSFSVVFLFCWFFVFCAFVLSNGFLPFFCTIAVAVLTHFIRRVVFQRVFLLDNCILAENYNFHTTWAKSFWAFEVITIPISILQAFITCSNELANSDSRFPCQAAENTQSRAWF